MRTLACGVVMLVFAGALGMVDADEPMPSSSPEQQAAPQEQAAVKEPASTQPTIAPPAPNHRQPSRRSTPSRPSSIRRRGPSIWACQSN